MPNTLVTLDDSDCGYRMLVGRYRSPFARGGAGASSRQVEFMQPSKVEKAGVCFGIGKQGGPITVEVRINHDTISALRGVQISFELLNGITPAQAKKLVDALNENVIGLLVTAASDDKSEAAAAGEVAGKL